MNGDGDITLFRAAEASASRARRLLLGASAGLDEPRIDRAVATLEQLERRLSEWSSKTASTDDRT